MPSWRPDDLVRQGVPGCPGDGLNDEVMPLSSHLVKAVSEDLVVGLKERFSLLVLVVTSEGGPTGRRVPASSDSMTPVLNRAPEPLA